VLQERISRLNHNTTIATIGVRAIAISTLLVFGSAAGCSRSTDRTAPTLLEVRRTPQDAPLARDSGGAYPLFPYPSFRVQVATKSSYKLAVRMDGKDLVNAVDSTAPPDPNVGRFTPQLVSATADTYVWNLSISRAAVKKNSADWSEVTISKQDDPSLATSFWIRARVQPSDVFFSGATPLARAKTNSKNPAFVIARNVWIGGWIIDDPDNAGPCTPEVCPEDLHWNLSPDPEFIAAHYGPSSGLTGLMLPGHAESAPACPVICEEGDPPQEPAKAMLFDDFDRGGTSRGITVNSFVLANSPHGTTLHFELNLWSVAQRGNPPAGWIEWPEQPTLGLYVPLDPRNPGAPRAFAPGDYVIGRGTLWQDGNHVSGWMCKAVGGVWCRWAQPGNVAERQCWSQGSIPPDPSHGWTTTRWMNPHAGWVELHPVDWIYKPDAQPRQKTVQMVSVCVPVEILDASRTKNVTIQAPAGRQAGESMKYVELVDGRFTDERNLDDYTVTPSDDHLDVHVKVHSSGTASGQAREGRFKATYIIWWGKD
jgi:hypothetical protein